MPQLVISCGIFPWFTPWRTDRSPFCWMENSIWLWVRATRSMHLLGCRIDGKNEQLRKRKPGVKFPLASLLLLSVQLMFSQNVPDSQKNPFAGTPAAATQGKKLFDQACAACHGSAGRGGRGPALAAGKFHQGSTDFDLFQNIRNGIPGTQMPSFSVVSSDGVWQLVAYIRSLSSRGVEDEALRAMPPQAKRSFLARGDAMGAMR